jgi:hypothetical protein
MTSPVPLKAYNHHSSLDDYTDRAIEIKRECQSYEDEGYDPYLDAPSTWGRPWSDMAFTESVMDDMDKASLSYSSKKLGN